MSEQEALEPEALDDGEQVEEVDQELDESQEDDQETGELEIIAEGEEEPASQTVPLDSYLKRVKKLTGRVEAVNTEKSEVERKAEALEEENKLLRLKLKQPEDIAAPHELDFDSDVEYELAKRKFTTDKARQDSDQLTALVSKEAQRIVAESGQATATAASEKAFEDQLVTHYKRSDQLKVLDYDATEQVAIDIFGGDISKHIMANSDKSEYAMYHFGKPANARKAAEFKALIMNNPVQGMMKIGAYIDKLKNVRKSSQAAEPEHRLENGGSANKGTSRFLKGATFT